MNGLLSSASPWQNDSNSNINSTSKKRTPSLGITRNKTTKKNIKPSNNALDNIYDIDNEEKEI